MAKPAAPKPEPIDLAAIDAGLDGLTTDQIKARFFACDHDGARLIAEKAMCLKRLDAAGIQVDYDPPMLDNLRRIARGELVPEAAWRFYRSRNFPTIRRLPVERQRQLAADPMVPMVVPTPGGGFTTRMIDLAEASRDETRIVVGPEDVRPPEQQAPLLLARKAGAKPPRPTIDPVPTVEKLAHRMPGRLTDSELETLRIHAAMAHISEGDMVRRTLAKAGMFDYPRPRIERAGPRQDSRPRRQV